MRRSVERSKSASRLRSRSSSCSEAPAEGEGAASAAGATGAGRISGTLAPRSCLHFTGLTAAGSSARTLHDILLATRLHAESTLGLQLTGNGVNLLLRCFHLFDANRPERLDVFLKHLGSPLGHAAQELFLELGAGSLQCDRQNLAVDLRHQRFHAIGI